MKPADLQNITEIIRIMSNLFQGHLPEGHKYKNEKLFEELGDLAARVPAFYRSLLSKTDDRILVEEEVKAGE